MNTYISRPDRRVVTVLCIDSGNSIDLPERSAKIAGLNREWNTRDPEFGQDQVLEPGRRNNQRPNSG